MKQASFWVLCVYSVTQCIPILKLLSHLHFRKKSSRTITFDEFKAALGELARKKYKEKTGEEAEDEVFKLIEGKAPVIAGVTVRLSYGDFIANHLQTTSNYRTN